MLHYTWLGRLPTYKHSSLFFSIHKLRGKWSILITLGAIFTTIHFHNNLQINPISYSVTLHMTGKASHVQTLQLILSIHKLCRKWSILIIILGAVFTTIHFLCNLWMGQIILSVALYLVRKTCRPKTHQLIGSIGKLQGKSGVANKTPGALFTKIHFCHNLRLCPII